MTKIEEYQSIGTRPIRPDGIEKVTGRAKFGADEMLPGMLYGRVLRSPHAHARILSVDTSEAEQVPGVMAVVTGNDFENTRTGSPALQSFAENIMASSKVLYHGHAVAAVAAQSNAAAEAGLEAIKVTYEPLESVMDAVAAMQDDAPVLHESMFTQGLETQPAKPSNISRKQTITKGNIDEGFSEADHVIERRFVTPMVHQGYIEPHACTANFQEKRKGNPLVQYAGTLLTCGNSTSSHVGNGCRRSQSNC